MGDYQELISRMQASGVLRTPAIADAFQAVCRRDFLPDDQQRYEAEDRALPIGHGQTNSQPSTVAFMLELLQPQSGDRILDVGSGSGWTTALLGHIAGSGGRVYGVEVVGWLVEFGRRNLEQYDYQNVDIRRAGDGLGLPGQAPFERVLVSAAAEELPHGLVEQLAVGGRMVIPVGHSVLCVDKTDEDDAEIEEFPGFAFVPLKE